MQNKTSRSNITSKLYLFLPFLLVDQESHRSLGLLSYPLVRGFLGILEGLKKKKKREVIQRENFLPIDGLMCQVCVILVKVFILQNCSYVQLTSQ